MSLKFDKVGEPMKGFALASRKGIFGEVELKVDPAVICDYVDYKSYSYSRRYLYSIPLIIFYPDFVTNETQRSVQSDGYKDVILGDVLIFGCDKDDIRGLNDVEISFIKNNITMEKTNQVNHLLLNNVTMEERKPPLEVGE